MKVAFVSLNQEKLPDPVIPLGLLYVMANLPERHPSELWDLCFEEDPLGYLKRQVETFRPEILALGMRNIQNNDYSDYRTNIEKYKKIIDFLRSISSAPIVLGGGGFSVMPRELMASLRPDFGVSGEGESAFHQLVEVFESGGSDFSQIGNLLYFQEGKLTMNPQVSGFIDLPRLHSPSRDRVDERYYAQIGIDAVQTKRGCPLKCTYCTYPTIEGKTKRLREPEQVVAEMLEAVRTHPTINHFFIVDSVFNLPKTHAKEVCKVLIDQGWSIPWTCYVNPLGFDEELADLMRMAGSAGMEIGSDSGLDHVLANLKKGFTTEKIRALSQIAKKAGLRDCHTFILGTPGETLDDVHRTLDFIVDLDPFAAILGIWADDYEALDSNLALERQKFRDQVKAIVWEKKDIYPRWSVPSLGYNFNVRFFNILRKRGLQGPLWQHVRLMPAGVPSSVGRAPGDVPTKIWTGI